MYNWKTELNIRATDQSYGPQTNRVCASAVEELKRLTQVEADFEEIETRLEAAVERGDRLRDERDAAMEQAEEDVRELMGKVKALETELEYVKCERDDLLTLADEAEQPRSELWHRIAELEIERDKLRAKLIVKNYREDHPQIHALWRGLKDERDQLRDKVKELEFSRAAYKEYLTALRIRRDAEVAELEAERDDWKKLAQDKWAYTLRASGDDNFYDRLTDVLNREFACWGCTVKVPRDAIKVALTRAAYGG